MRKLGFTDKPDAEGSLVDSVIARLSFDMGMWLQDI